MIRAFINYLRSLKCDHNIEEIAIVRTRDVFLGDSTRVTYRCKKCGYTQRVRL